MAVTFDLEGFPAYSCSHCESFWSSVCDVCLSRECWTGTGVVCDAANGRALEAVDGA